MDGRRRKLHSYLATDTGSCVGKSTRDTDESASRGASDASLGRRRTTWNLLHMKTDCVARPGDAAPKGVGGLAECVARTRRRVTLTDRVIRRTRLNVAERGVVSGRTIATRRTCFFPDCNLCLAPAQRSHAEPDILIQKLIIFIHRTMVT